MVTSWPKEAAEFFLLDQHVSEVPVSELTIKEVNAAEQYMHAICMHMLFFFLNLILHMFIDVQTYV